MTNGDILAEKTGRYWRVSYAWYGRDPTTDLHVGSALTKLKDLESELGPRRPLRARCTALLWKAIFKGPKRKKNQKVAPTNVLRFARR